VYNDAVQQIGVIGLGTMGANIARNAARNGAQVAVFNRTTEKMETFLSLHGKEGRFIKCKTLEELSAALKPPRVVLLMVSAGSAVDLTLEELLSQLEYGDIVIDGGNSHYRDTERREELLGKRGIRFLGLGISGGEQGALEGPSMMAGGSHDAFNIVEPLLRDMAAEDGEDGKCVAFMGKGGAGHFVKMVHNGIEYGVMQLIAESYDLLRGFGANSAEVSRIITSWLQGDLQSFLMETTAKVLARKEDESGSFLVDLIKDSAGQKGTGRWTTEAAMLYGTAIPTITAAVDARFLSQLPEERMRRSKTFEAATVPDGLDVREAPELFRTALTAATLLTYSQGFELLSRASHAESWGLPLVSIARIWRGGCIIRSPLLKIFQHAYGGTSEDMKRERQAIINRLSGENLKAIRRTVASAVSRGIPVPSFSATLAYYDSIRASRLPQNLIQAQRDAFGAHTFERTDKSGSFHVNWN